MADLGPTHTKSGTASVPLGGAALPAEQRISLVRLVFVATGTLLYALFLREQVHHPKLTLACAAGTWAYGLYVFSQKPYRRWPILAGYCTTGADLACVLAWVYLTGGIDSPFHVAMYLAVISAAFRFPRRAAFVAAFAYAAGYVGVALYSGGAGDHAPELSVRLSCVFLAAVLGDAISRELSRQIERRAKAEERARADDVLRRSELQLAKAQRLAHLGSWEWNLEKDEISWSAEMYRIFGVSKESFTPTLDALFKLIHPMDRAPVSEFMKAIGKGGGFVEHRVVRPSGDVRWIRCHGEYMLDEQGGVTHMVGSSQDITEQRTNEDSLRRMSRVFTEAAHPIFVKDLKSVIVDMNSAAEEHYGFSRDELIGESIARILPASEREREGQLMQACLRGAEVRSVEAARVTRDGRVRTVLLTLSRLSDEGGQVTGVAAILEDVTRLKEAEQKLRQAQKMEAVGVLASGVAHDFNNLLMGVIGCADIALSTLPPQRGERVYLQEIKKAAHSGAAISRQLLFMSEKSGETSVFELNGVIAGFAKMLERLLGERIELNLRLAAKDSRIRSHPGQIEQILMNLAINARDAMPAGGALSIETAEIGPCYDLESEESGRCIRLSVVDCGTGMSENTRRRIFEPFFTTKEAGKGSGLGLSSVYGIVKQAGGSIRVDSEQGRGTAFEILLPLAEGPVTRVAPAARAEEERADGTVLLVEDEQTVRIATRFYLEQCGGIGCSKRRVVPKQSTAVAVSLLPSICS